MQLNSVKSNGKKSFNSAGKRKIAGISLALAVVPFSAVPAANATVGSQTVVGSTLGSSSFGSSTGSSAGSTTGSSLPGSSAPGSSGLAGSLQPGNPGNPGTPDAQSTFERTATFPVYENRPDGEDKSTPTVAEISTVSKDGKTLIHTCLLYTSPSPRD